MGKVKVPSIQHAAAIWDSQPSRIAKRLLNLAQNSPPFSYANLYKLTCDLLSRSVPYEQVRASASMVKPMLARQNYLDILPLLKAYADSIGPATVVEVIPRHYSIGRDLRALVNPPLAYYQNELGFLPWFIFWKTNYFNEPRLRLFVTMLRETFIQDPDYDDATLKLVVCSEVEPQQGRRLEIIDLSSIPSLGRQDRDEMLGVFSEGYALAVQAQVAGTPMLQDPKDDHDTDDDQFDLFA